MLASMFLGSTLCHLSPLTRAGLSTLQPTNISILARKMRHNAG